MFLRIEKHFSKKLAKSSFWALSAWAESFFPPRVCRCEFQDRFSRNQRKKERSNGFKELEKEFHRSKCNGIIERSGDDVPETFKTGEFVVFVDNESFSDFLQGTRRVVDDAEICAVAIENLLRNDLPFQIHQFALEDVSRLLFVSFRFVAIQQLDDKKVKKIKKPREENKQDKRLMR